MSDRDLGAVGDRDEPGGGPGGPSGSENASVSDVAGLGTSGDATSGARTDRAIRTPGERPEGDDDWGASDAGQALGPADAPSDPSDVGGD